MKQDIQRVLRVRIIDKDPFVRTAAVCAMNAISDPDCLHRLLSRLDDTDASVRKALFDTLARDPSKIDIFGPRALARLVAGLLDRSRLVHDAAKLAVSKWVEHSGGPVQLLAKCDIFSNEYLAQDCASQLAQHCLPQSTKQVCQWLRSGGTCFPQFAKQAALLTRFSLGFMSDEERDDAIDVPVVLHMVRESLTDASQDPTQSDFLLRQLLHITGVLDFCDEALRRSLATLSADVLSTAPVSLELEAIPDKGKRMKATVHTAIDLGVLLLRKAFGLDRRHGKHQTQEIRVTERIMTIIGDVVKVRVDGAAETQDEEAQIPDEAEPYFAAISRKLEVLSIDIAELEVCKMAREDAKMKAIQCEDFEEAHNQKEVLINLEAELKPMREHHAILLQERDGICHRTLAIVSSLLKWTNSDIRKDGILLSMLTVIVRPILKMKALSEEVSLRALHAIGLFCSHDVELAQNHWEFFTRLLSNLGELHAGDTKTTRTNVRRAMLAATTLSDCARLHGMMGFFDRDQVLSAAAVLAVVPYDCREVSIYPLCGWFMSFGAMYFEEHMANPQPEVTWALGWMLAEAFSNRARETVQPTLETPDSVKDDIVPGTFLKSQATDLMVFFNILSKHPGRHGEALLCLAVESIIETGLWRCAVSLPVDGHNQQFTRGFSWPTMFEFVRSRLPDSLQLRLWRCCLQVCVTSPALAPWAQIPLALAAGIANAPPGTAELVKTAISLGADADALSPVLAGLPPLEDIEVPEQAHLLCPHHEAIKAEEALVAELSSLDVKISDWAPPASLRAPRGKPLVAVDGALRAVAMRSICKAKRSAYLRGTLEKALPEPEVETVLPVVATPSRAKTPMQQDPMIMESEARPHGTKRTR